ncbi:hypothetical protein Pla110_22380 [Polystyrenella longa]|uniref:Uncharacterized protein n=1 Tax=Polystyrenella longa TaxID=2528007 RepID=A0A518CMR3_9PLAN|nr:hypothetical protein Pla110_22380 [Polystyrenella longa]
MLEQWQIEFLESIPGWREFCAGTLNSSDEIPQEEAEDIAAQKSRQKKHKHDWSKVGF